MTAHSEEELAQHNSLLVKRASLAHPNVPKLIYFTNVDQDTICSHSQFKLKVYLEHIDKKLTAVAVEERNKDKSCLCCGGVNGVRYLV